MPTSERQVAPEFFRTRLNAEDRRLTEMQNSFAAIASATLSANLASIHHAALCTLRFFYRSYRKIIPSPPTAQPCFLLMKRS